MAVNLLISKRKFSKEESRQWGALIKAIVADGTMLRLLSKYAERDAAAKMLTP